MGKEKEPKIKHPAQKEEDLEIKTPKELEEAKKTAGVTSHEEVLKRYGEDIDEREKKIEEKKEERRNLIEELKTIMSRQGTRGFNDTETLKIEKKGDKKLKEMKEKVDSKLFKNLKYRLEDKIGSTDKEQIKEKMSEIEENVFKLGNKIRDFFLNELKKRNKEKIVVPGKAFAESFSVGGNCFCDDSSCEREYWEDVLIKKEGGKILVSSRGPGFRVDHAENLQFGLSPGPVPAWRQSFGELQKEYKNIEIGEDSFKYGSYQNWRERLGSPGGNIGQGWRGGGNYAKFFKNNFEVGFFRAFSGNEFSGDEFFDKCSEPDKKIKHLEELAKRPPEKYLDFTSLLTVLEVYECLEEADKTLTQGINYSTAVEVKKEQKLGY